MIGGHYGATDQMGHQHLPEPQARRADEHRLAPRWRRLLRSVHWCLMSTLLVVGLCAAAVTAHADSQDERRVRTGARLFRALLAADMDIDRRVGAKGWLDVGIFATRAEDADALSRLMVPADAPGQALVRGHPMRVRRMQTLIDAETAPAAVFLATRLSDAELDQLIDWSRRQRVLLYSPYEGDVERGVMAGLSIEAKVVPYVNQSALTAAQVQLKPFFMKVAKVHP